MKFKLTVILSLYFSRILNEKVRQKKKAATSKLDGYDSKWREESPASLGGRHWVMKAIPL